MILFSVFKTVAARFDTFCGYVDRASRYTLIFLSSLIFILLMLQVVMRYLIRSPLAWVEELTSYALAYLVLFACSSYIRSWQHIRVDTFANAFPKSLQTITFAAINILVIYFAYLIIFSGYRLALLGAGDLTPSGAFTLYWPRMALVIGGALIMLQAFNNLLRAISGKVETLLASK
ncbi:TRAP transporter small permease [Halomonas ramblicola]|uniref:TRAP transporter small permease n=1 Tax=Halomonas ramblicola TaxID=747349 RepID=UPI0025B36997|nr:TRAP transporter small permease [Halomonas ramblicola]MDN3523177.1 TRAP transporter small permease [Halomonas ramblicola]